MAWLKKPAPTWLLLVAIIGIALATNFNGITTTLKTALLPKPDFTLTASPNPAPVLEEGQGYRQHGTIIKIGAQNDFTGTVNIAVSSLPPGLYFWISGPGSAFFPGPEQSVNLTFTTTLIGDYPVVVTGVSGGLSHSLTVTVMAQGLTLGPNSITVPQGSSTSSKVTVTSLNGLAGNFTVSYAPETPPHIDPGFEASGTPSIIIAADGTATLTITIITTAQFYQGFLSIAITTPLGIRGLVLPIVAA